MGIHIKLLVNDFRKMAWKNIVLFVFVCLSVTIAATAVLMLSQLFSSIRLGKYDESSAGSHDAEIKNRLKQMRF